jgi:type I restriction enzyme, R subunit
MNEADTRANLIDPQLIAAGWGVVAGSRILREYHINAGEIKAGGFRGNKMIADYVLVYNNRKLAVIEAKSNEVGVGEGVAQAKLYAQKLDAATTFAANGKSIYQICMQTFAEGEVGSFPTPDELWAKTFAKKNEWLEKFSAVPFEDVNGSKQARYYQEVAVNKVMQAIAEDKSRILLTLATGTGKTFVAFQIAWKLFKSRWNLQRDGIRTPRILFLADRNILANQAFNAFGAFPDNALVRISPNQITKTGSVPTNGNVFFTIFQTFMSGADNKPHFGQYPADFFDVIIVDECHRGGANDESTWRSILDYFAPAVKLGLTATPKLEDNANTYTYFGEPVYKYSLRDGVGDGFLTPFKVRRIQTTLDEYVYTSDDEVVEGDVEEGHVYKESDFNKVIEIEARERKRVELMLANINPKEKTIVFCANQAHAAKIRDYINQMSPVNAVDYCVRVTANDGSIGEQHLKQFQDNEKTIPTILTTSQKLSTGVDALNVRNIVLMRPVNSMIEFKQIIGRGTRLFEGKHYFTIIDFVNASHQFAQPDWDGEPIPPDEEEDGDKPTRNEGDGGRNDGDDGDGGRDDDEAAKKLRIRLSDGKVREIQSMASTMFLVDGKPISSEEFFKRLFNILALPTFFGSEAKLREIWASPITRRDLLAKLEQSGCSKSDLLTVQKLINAENSDLFDVLEYVAYASTPISRQDRVNAAKNNIYAMLTEAQREFVSFVLHKYVAGGVDELDDSKLSGMIMAKYHSIDEAEKKLGDVSEVRKTFIDFQRHLYLEKIA